MNAKRAFFLFAKQAFAKTQCYQSRNSHDMTAVQIVMDEGILILTTKIFCGLKQYRIYYCFFSPLNRAWNKGATSKDESRSRLDLPDLKSSKVKVEFLTVSEYKSGTRL